MFSKNSQRSNSAVGQQSVGKPSPPSIISGDLKIVGDLNCEGEIQVDGSIDGDIRTKSLVVGETAKIKGGIGAETVIVHGNINGQIKSRDVKLAKTAHVVGDILHENLTIETGAFLEGHCNRIVEKPAAEPKTLTLGSDDTNRRLAKIKEGGGANADEKKEATKADEKKEATKTVVSS